MTLCLLEQGGAVPRGACGGQGGRAGSPQGPLRGRWLRFRRPHHPPGRDLSRQAGRRHGNPRQGLRCGADGCSQSGNGLSSKEPCHGVMPWKGLFAKSLTPPTHMSPLQELTCLLHHRCRVCPCSGRGPSEAAARQVLERRLHPHQRHEEPAKLL